MKIELQFGGVGIEIKGLRGLLSAVVIALVGAAVAHELARPADQRAWHGKLGGIVPYDLRPPTLDRLREAFWNPESDRILSDRALGIGWDINVGAVARRLKLVGGEPAHAASCSGELR